MQLIYQFSSKLIYKYNITFDEVECGQVLEYILLAISELRKRPGKSEVDNGSWDCFRGRKQKPVPQNSPVMHCQRRYYQASCAIPKWLMKMWNFNLEWFLNLRKQKTSCSDIKEETKTSIFQTKFQLLKIFILS